MCALDVARVKIEQPLQEVARLAFQYRGPQADAANAVDQDRCGGDSQVNPDIESS